MSDEQSDETVHDYPGGVPSEDKPERFEPGDEESENGRPDAGNGPDESSETDEQEPSEQEPSEQEHHNPDTDEDTASGGAPEP